jgi:hypothetical protein
MISLPESRSPAYQRLLRSTIAFAGAAVLVCTVASATPPPMEPPSTIEFYYKIKLGHANEWLDLYRRHHWPIMVAEMKAGYIRHIEITRPQATWPEPYRWDVRISITYRDLGVAHGRVDTGRQATIARLFPDGPAHQTAEQRRFELLDGQWDVELDPIATEAWPDAQAH